jgi:hypothetical protein
MGIQETETTTNAETYRKTSRDERLLRVWERVISTIAAQCPCWIARTRSLAKVLDIRSYDDANGGKVSISCLTVTDTPTSASADLRAFNGGRLSG